MKNILSKLFLVVLAVIGSVFALGVYLFGFNGNGNIFSNIGSQFAGVSYDSNISDVASDLEEWKSNLTVNVRYTGGAKTVGDVSAFRDMFDITFLDQDGAQVNNINYDIYLSDIRDTSDNSVVVRMTTENIDKLEEIPADVLYDTEQHNLYYYKSGVYTVYISIYLYDGSTFSYEFVLPVEAR